MAENSTKIVITAEDKTSAALQSVTRGLQGMESHAAKAAAALGALGVTFSAAAAVAFVKGTIDAADGMNDLSQKVGIGIRQLAGWTLAANQSGTSMEAVAKGIKGLSGFIVEHGDKLRAAGITATDVDGAMVQLADLFKDMPDGIEKTTLAVKLFGKAGMDMIPLLNMGSAGLAEAKQKADEYGRRLAEIAPDADKFNDQLEEMALQSKGLGISIAQHFLPGLIGLSQWLIDVKNNGKEAFTAIEWMFGERAAKAAALAGLGRSGLSREASGKIGGKVAGMTPEEEEKLGAANIARMKSLGIIGPEKPDKGKVQGPIDVFGSGSYITRDKAVAESIRASFEFENWAQGQLAKEAEALDEKARKMDEAHMARMEAQRIEAEGEEAIREHLEKTSRAIEKQDDLARSLGMTFSSAFEDAVIGGKKAGEVIRSLAQDVARIFLRKTVTEPMAGKMSGLFSGSGLFDIFGGLFNPTASSAASGWDFGPALADTGFSFAGGGYTGSGARSGGLDGQGGFLAMLHPQESVIDHANGGSGGAVTVILQVSTGVAQTVRAEMANLLPSISASVQAAVMDSRLRGGSTRAAFRG